MTSNFKFSAISQNTNSEDEKFSPYEMKKEFYVSWGVYNEMPNELIYLFNNSSIHNTCVNAIAEAIMGDGLTCDQPEILDKANNDGETWNDILAKVAKDYKLFGAFALEIIWSKDRTKIAEVYHIDFSLLRAKNKNHRGKVPGYWISDEWGRKANFQEMLDVPFLPVFNPATNRDEPNQIYVHQPYRPGMRYYPMPDYVGALKVIDLDVEVDTFHLANVKNGGAPSIAITTFTNANEDDRAAIEMNLQNQYAGARNAGRILYMDVDAPENAPKIETIETNTADGYYSELNDSTTQKILTAHRITSPEIFGIMTPGKLGGKEEVMNAYLMFLNTVIKPFQSSILDVFNYILDFNYGEVKLGIIQTKLFEDGSTEEEVVSGLDAENGEDAALETQIERSDEINQDITDQNI